MLVTWFFLAFVPASSPAQTARVGDALRDTLERRVRAIDSIERRLQNEFESQREINALWIDCGGNGASTAAAAECAPIQELRRTLPDVVRELRLNLALAYRDPMTQMASKSVSASVTAANLALNPMGTYRARPWAPLTPSELTRVGDEMARLRAEATREAAAAYPDNPKAREDFGSLWLRHARQARLSAYAFTLAHFPILQYIDQVDFGPAELAAAAAQVQLNLESEASRASRRRLALEAWRRDVDGCVATAGIDLPVALDCAATPSILFGALEYRELVDAVTRENPGLTPIVNELGSEQRARGWGEAALVVPATLALFVVAPPMIALGAGALAAVHQWASAQADLAHALERELSRTLTVMDTPADFAGILSAQNARNLSLVLMPLAFIPSAWSLANRSANVLKRLATK